MYAIYGNIYHQYTPNVSIYTIHGSYGYVYILKKNPKQCSKPPGRLIFDQANILFPAGSAQHAQPWFRFLPVGMICVGSPSIFQSSQNSSLPSGELTKNYGKSPCVMGKSTISMAMFNCYVSSPEGTTNAAAKKTPQRTQRSSWYNFSLQLILSDQRHLSQSPGALGAFTATAAATERAKSQSIQINS